MANTTNMMCECDVLIEITFWMEMSFKCKSYYLKYAETWLMLHFSLKINSTFMQMQSISFENYRFLPCVR